MTVQAVTYCYPANFGELFALEVFFANVHVVVIDILEFFFAPAALIFLTALLEIVKDAVPKFEIFGDAKVTAVFLNVAVTLHFEVGEDDTSTFVPDLKAKDDADSPFTLT